MKHQNNQPTPNPTSPNQQPTTIIIAELTSREFILTVTLCATIVLLIVALLYKKELAKGQKL
jgi:cell division protein FtsL